MSWVLLNPQLHSTFGSLGYQRDNVYHKNENCYHSLETILNNILTEDPVLRTYRRNISFGQNVKNDLIPLLINATEDKIIAITIKILVNLTIPVECLLSVYAVSQTDLGRHTIYEINKLLKAGKEGFSDCRSTKVVIDYLKRIIENENQKWSPGDTEYISNCILLMRNILHIPDDSPPCPQQHVGMQSTTQNQIMWNLFSQNIDKVLIQLMTCKQASIWSVSMVQLVALLYKDQHVGVLQKMLNQWLENPLSDSSDENESNTSPPNRGSGDSSPMHTPETTSDSSDNGGNGKSKPNMANASTCNQNETNIFKTPSISRKYASMETKDFHGSSSSISHPPKAKRDCKGGTSDLSDYGYCTQIEKQESISTSSNEDDAPREKVVHQKPHSVKQSKQRANPMRKIITLQDKKDKRRKKLVKRGKTCIISVKSMANHMPTDYDISTVLKEFTVDFLLKGYSSLVKTLHMQLLTDLHLQIDTSHFFWLLTYFLKFAAQLELDIEHISQVLSYDIITFLISEGVSLCEKLELDVESGGTDLKSCLRRMHLAVTAIREFIQTIEIYKKISHLNAEKKKDILQLQIKICDTEELRQLFVLLIKHYRPEYQTKQYLQDLIVTNHNLLLLLDSVMKLSEYQGSTNMLVHIKQFATRDIIKQYSLMLDNYATNGEFVNDCIFTIMHHIGGDLNCLSILFQPSIIKVFSHILKSEYEICDDWSDLIEYVVNAFITKPRMDMQCLVNFPEQGAAGELTPTPDIYDQTDGDAKNDLWADDELSSLQWKFMQSIKYPDIISNIISLYEEDGSTKSRLDVINKLNEQHIINSEKYEQFITNEGFSEEIMDFNNFQDGNSIEDIDKLCEQLAKMKGGNPITWLQNNLLEACFIKIWLDKGKANLGDTDPKLIPIDDAVQIIAPVAYHSIVANQSIPLVPWNSWQQSVSEDLRFSQLLHRLGFHLPTDSGKLFVRIPNFWTAEVLYEVAAKIAPIDTSNLKFSINDIAENNLLNTPYPEKMDTTEVKETIITDTSSALHVHDNPFRIHRLKQANDMIHFTPQPGPSHNSMGSSNNDDTINRANWMELVKKSKQTKILSTANADRVHIVAQTTEVTCLQPISIPAIVPMQTIQELSNNFRTSEYNSLCDTDSVDTDLIRMYVSDEEELIN